MVEKKRRSRALIVAVAVVAVVVLAGGAFAFVTGWPASTAEPTTSFTPVAETPEPTREPVATPTATPLPDVTVSVLGGINVGVATDGIVLTEFKSNPSLTAVELQSELDAAVAGANYVIVNAGISDLVAGESAADTAADILLLWQGVRDRGAIPIAALNPPLNDAPAEAIALKDLLIANAQQQGVPVLDLYTPVANPDGTWIPASTDNGRTPNSVGGTVMTRAALQQLPALVGRPAAE